MRHLAWGIFVVMFAAGDGLAAGAPPATYPGTGRGKASPVLLAQEDTGDPQDATSPPAAVPPVPVPMPAIAPPAAPASVPAPPVAPAGTA